MRSYQRYVFWFAALAITAWTAPRALLFAEDTPPLKLVKTIELKDIRSGEPDVSADQLVQESDDDAHGRAFPIISTI